MPDTPHDTGRPGSDLEPRVAVLEKIASTNETAIADLRAELRAFRAEMQAFWTEIYAELRAIRAEHRSDFRWL